MKKFEFLSKLEHKLKNEDQKDEILGYYQELIEEATLNGEDEEVFIKRLGSVEMINQTLENEPAFIENLKKKKNYNIHRVFSKTILIVARIIYWLFVFVVGLITFSLFASSIGIVFQTIIFLIYEVKSTTLVMLVYQGLQILIAISFVLFGMALIKYLQSDLQQYYEKIKIRLSKFFSKEK